MADIGAIFTPDVVALWHGVILISVILIIGLPILALVAIMWYADRM
jgi:hypothetical protein